MRKTVMAIANANTSEQMVKASEVLARAAAGLALEGIEVFLRFGDEYTNDD